MKIIDFILKNVQKRRNKTALSLDNIEFTWEDLLNEVIKAEKILKNFNIQKKVCAIYQKNTLKQIIYFLAVSKCCGIPLLIHEYMKESDILKLIERENIPFIWSDSAIENIELNENGIGTLLKSDKTSQGDFALLTSGTTSLPKCYYRNFSSWSNFFPSQEKIFDYNENSSLYMHGSFAFTGNLNMLFAFWNCGATVVSTSKLTPKKWIHTVKTKKITHLYMIPTKLTLISRISDKNETLKYILTGSQMMTEPLWKNLKNQFINAKFILYYGTSEASYISYIDGETMNWKNPTVGKTVENVEITVKNDELYVKTPYGIIGLPSPYPTHDCGEINESGEIILKGRNDEVYTIHGNHVYGQYVEKTLKEQNLINDAVIVYQKKYKKERLIGIISATGELNKNELLSALRKKLLPWEIPEQFLIVKEIPKTSTGKYNRKKIEEILQKEKFI